MSSVRLQDPRLIHKNKLCLYTLVIQKWNYKKIPIRIDSQQKQSQKMEINLIKEVEDFYNTNWKTLEEIKAS